MILYKSYVLNVKFLLRNSSADIFLGMSQFSRIPGLTCTMMTFWERDNWHWCIWMLWKCLHLCLDCVTVNDDSAFLTPDISAPNTHQDLWLFINLSAAADIHHPLTLRACLFNTHTHTQRPQQYSEGPPLADTLFFSLALGRLRRYPWRMKPLTISVLLFLFPPATVVFLSWF